MPAHPNHPRRHRLARASAIVATAVLVALPTLGAGAAPAQDGFTGSSGEAALSPGRGSGTAPASRAARAGSVIRGIDVSHWQGPIDWSRVADADKAFAYLKSTDDIDFVDETFAFNRSQAKANGIAVGAYHFARPDRSKGDAVREAKWFVARTDPRPGELIPVLDIETNDGLTHTQMTTWAHRWIAKVRELTGVTAMVYTSPYGWLERFGGSKRLAREGSPLWVAHWGVSSPLVPAGNWDGKGWVMWQHTSHGRVPGIQGRVDLDRLSSGTLARLTIRKLSLDVQGAGVVTSTPGGFGCAAICEKTVNPDATVTLTAVPDDDAFFTGWGGDCHGTGPTCTVTMQGNRSLRAEFVTDITPPVATLRGSPDRTGPVRVGFDEAVRRVRATNVVLRRADGDRVLVSRTCRGRAGRPVPCVTGDVRSVHLRPRDPLVRGRRYEVVVNPAGVSPVIDRVGNPAEEAVLRFTA